MNFTREPIVETIITPKEGYKLVLRNSKSSTSEEFFVDSIQVINLGGNCFYRSLEKPKAFMIPCSDYEVIEVRDTKVMLKMPGVEKGGIKIGGGRETNLRPQRPEIVEEAKEEAEVAQEEMQPALPRANGGDRKKERKRFRKKKDKDVRGDEEVADQAPTFRREERSLIPPPPTLISETISRYKDIPSFAGAFFDKEEEVLAVEEEKRVEEFTPDVFPEDSEEN